MEGLWYYPKKKLKTSERRFLMLRILHIPTGLYYQYDFKTDGRGLHYVLVEVPNEYVSDKEIKLVYSYIQRNEINGHKLVILNTITNEFYPTSFNEFCLVELK